ncbi:DNA end-binding protein Ku [Neorhizobium alkalisoli]|uniref:Non-homologous end joining protein Ku n=2 Tax=Neorhizobium alkalisoli TaxID=528178 RepID=A0A561Q0S6_9HYPH|nr:DNA end-binding protein Ku [Neorhizobium alkalisoli]
MAAHRAQWKGVLKVGEVSCGVALHTAASTSDRISFNLINTASGNRLNRVFIDSETEKPVEREEQVKGFELENGHYLLIDPEEIAATIPESDKTLDIDAFISCSSIDDVYFDKPYYLIPDEVSDETFALLREAMTKDKVAAIAHAVLFRRMRTVLIRPHDKGMIATTLQYDYEVRSAEKAFKRVPKMKIEGEMLDLARHIIATKMGKFDPATFDDRYEDALADLVKAKIEGRAVPKRKKVTVSKPNDLLAALRESAGMAKKSEGKNKPAAANTDTENGKQSGTRKTAAKSAASKPAQQRKAG